jgi:hypothetical protein
MEFQQTNILSMTGNDDFATISDLSNYVDLTTNQTIASGIKTFTTLPQSSAVPSTGNQLVNKTYIDGAFVTLGTTQTITGAKTINANLRLNNTRQLIFGTTTGCSLSFTSPSLMVYDNQAGGTHFFFVSGSPSVDIDSNGLVIRTGKKVQFYAGATIFENTGGNAFDTDIISGYTYNFKINSVDKFKIHPTFGCYVTDDLNLTTQKYINWTGGSFQQEDSVGLAYVYNVPSTFNHSFKINNTEVVKISTDVNGTLFTFPAGTIMREYTSFNWFLYQLPASHTLKYQVGGVDIMEVSNSGAIIYESLSMRDGKRVVWDEGFTNLAYLRKDTTTSTFDYEVATGYSHKFMVNSVAQLLLNTSGATFTGPIFMKATQPIYLDDTLLGGAIASGGSGGIRFDADTGGTFRFINDSTLALTINGTLITIPVNQTLQFGPTGSNITSTATSLQYNVPTGSSHHFRVNSSIIGSISSTGLLFPVSNSTLTFGVANVCSITQNTASTAFRYEAPTGYTHRMRINGLTQLQVLPGGLQITGGYYTKLGSGGAFQASVFNNAWTFPNYTAYIDGTNIGNYTISDVRIKKNIVKARPVLDRLCKLSMIEYNYIENGLFKDDGILHYGYIAQEIKKEFEEFPNLTIGEDTDMTDDGNIQPIRVNAEFSNLFMGAVIELNAKVEAQQKQIEAQQAQIDSLLVAMAKLLSP